MQTLRKSERLCNFRLKELLFNQGESFFAYPFRVFYFTFGNCDLENFFFNAGNVIFEGRAEELSEIRRKQNPSWPYRKLPAMAFFSHPAKMMVSVPRKNFKKAVARNRIKRLVKESYRKNKSVFYSFLEGRGEFCLLAFVYTARELLPYSEIENKIIISLQKLAGVISGTEKVDFIRSESAENGHH